MSFILQAKVNTFHNVDKAKLLQNIDSDNKYLVTVQLFDVQRNLVIPERSCTIYFWWVTICEFVSFIAVAATAKQMNINIPIRPHSVPHSFCSGDVWVICYRLDSLTLSCTRKFFSRDLCMDGISGPHNMFCFRLTDRAWFGCRNPIFFGKIMLAGYFSKSFPPVPLSRVKQSIRLFVSDVLKGS